MPSKSKSKLKKQKHTKHLKKNNSDLLRKLIFLIILLGLSIFIVKTITDEQAKGKINVTVESHEYDRDDYRTGGTDHMDNGNNKDPRTSPSGTPGVTINNVQPQGAYFQFDPAAANVKVGDQFDVKVVVNTYNKQVLSSEAYVLFNNTNLQVVSVQEGTFFPVTNYVTASNSVVIRGLVNEPAAYREGIGILATVTFKAVQNGVSQLTAYCNLQAGNTSKIIENNIDAQNIIDCAGNQYSTITVGSGQGTGTISPNPTSSVRPTKKPSPTKIPVDDKRLKIIIAIILIILVILIMILGI